MRNIGIIGIGPRGGYAVEQLVIKLVKLDCLAGIHLMLFEATGKFGNGPVYDLGQSSSNWINITERILKLEKRPIIETDSLFIEEFPSYHDWVQKDFSSTSSDLADTYPPRAQIGKYLSQRFESLVQPLIQKKIVSLLRRKVKQIQLLSNQRVKIETYSDFCPECDEVLLTIGHQPTLTSNQISEWDSFVKNKKDISLFKSPYPTSEYLNNKYLNADSTVGIRGFGLAMIDVTRAVAEKFGNFITINENTKSLTYQTKDNIQDLVVPFSLNGAPPVPKPLNARIDSWFEPKANSILQFAEAIGNRETQRKAKDIEFLLNPFATIATEVFTGLKFKEKKGEISNLTLKNLIKQWLKNQDIEHILITSKEQSVQERMRNFVDMATGQSSISLDYCIGQVWRHCQPTIYEQLSFNECSDEVFAEIIMLDESTKRYSYGPPVESIQQLLALSKAGVLNLDFANDPDIELTTEGWKLQNSKSSITATIMIDSVLDSPVIKKVNSSIVNSMLQDDIIQVVHDDLGVATDENGYLISGVENNKIPIALLGRLAKGTIIGVDAILECFGTRPQQWAEQAAENHAECSAKSHS